MAETRERLLEVTAYNLYLACLVGDPAPRVKRLYDRMKAPRVGDLVLEMSTIYWPDRVGTRLGRLERVADEPCYTPEGWAENGGGHDPVPTERVWYLTLADGREYRWINASFMAVPTTIDRHDTEFYSEPAAFGIPPATPPHRSTTGEAVKRPLWKIWLSTGLFGIACHEAHISLLGTFVFLVLIMLWVDL